MQISKEWSTISDFSKIVSERYNEIHEEKDKPTHYNTIYNWFNELEYRRIHYTQRLEGSEKRVFGTIDLEIALTIKHFRKQHWAMDQIYTYIEKNFDCREFPEDTDNLPSNEQMPTMNEIKLFFQNQEEAFKHDRNKFKDELLKEVEQRVESKYEEKIRQLTEQLEKFKALPQPEEKTPEQIRAERTENFVAAYRFSEKIEDEALGEWERLPESERMITVKSGWFSTKLIEDTEKRRKFVKKYIDERLSQMNVLKEEAPEK